MAYTRVYGADLGTLGTATVRRDADGAFIPDDPLNHDWLAFQDWLKAGNTPAEPAEPALPKAEA